MTQTDHIRLEVRGIAETQRDLRRLGRRDLVNELNREIRRALRPVVLDARARAPYRTGRLRKSIRVRKRGTKIGVWASTDPKRGQDYAAPIHWGWPARGIEGQPFLTDAWAGRQDEFVREFERALDKWAAKVKRQINLNANVGSRVHVGTDRIGVDTAAYTGGD